MMSDIKVLQDAATQTCFGKTLDVTNATGALFEITGTFNATITFEGLKKDDWEAVRGHKSTGDMSGTTATEPGVYTVPCAEHIALRARVSWISGTCVTVKGRVTN